MDEPASGLRDLAERALLAAVGAVALTAERADALADELAEKGGLRRDDARQLLEDARNRWRGDAMRMGERAGDGLHGFFQQLGLATRDDLEELELRVAQLEHRLRLLECVPRALPAEPAPKPAQPRRLDPREWSDRQRSPGP